MTAPGTALDAVIEALVTTFATALTVPVHNGRPVGSSPDRAQVIVGADLLDGEANSGMTSTEYTGKTGLGQRARTETITVPCLALYRAVSEADARHGAVELEKAAAIALVASPKLGLSYTYDALVTRIDRASVIPTKTGRLCALTFTVRVMARLV